MFALVMTAIVTMASLGLVAAASKSIEQRQRLGAENRTVLADTLMAAVKNYRDLYGSYPADLAQLQSAPGFAHTRLLDPQTQTSIGYKLASGTISDDNWSSLSRAAIYSVKAGANRPLLEQQIFGTTTAASCAANEPFCTQPYWTPLARTALYHASTDTRQSFATERARQRVRLIQTLARFANFYNAVGGVFPYLDASENMIKSGTLPSLSSASDPPAANNCERRDLKLLGSVTGNKVALLLGCEDVFDIWGGAVYYNRIKGNKIQLIATSPMKDKDGKPVVITEELDGDTFQ